MRMPLIALMVGALAASLGACSAAGRGDSAGGAPVATTPAGDPGDGSIGTPGPLPTGKTTYAGRTTNDRRAALAVVTNSGRAIAYLCDGTFESWLTGTVAPDGTVALKSRKGATLGAAIEGGQLAGTITAGGRTWRFAVPAVARDSKLYRATTRIQGAVIVAGWVVLADGTQVGAFTRDGGPPVTAPPVNPETDNAKIDGTTVTAREVDGLSLS